MRTSTKKLYLVARFAILVLVLVALSGCSQPLGAPPHSTTYSPNDDTPQFTNSPAETPVPTPTLTPTSSSQLLDDIPDGSLEIYGFAESISWMVNRIVQTQDKPLFIEGERTKIAQVWLQTQNADSFVSLIYDGAPLGSALPSSFCAKLYKNASGTGTPQIIKEITITDLLCGWVDIPDSKNYYFITPAGQEACLELLELIR